MWCIYSTVFFLVLEVASGAYSGDIVAFWNEGATSALSASSPRLSSLREAYASAIVHTAILQAADDSASRSRDVRQIAISIAAHHALARQFPAQIDVVDLYLREAEDMIAATAQDTSEGGRIGSRATSKVIASRANDKIDEYVRYEWKSSGTVGLYQPTPPRNILPMDPAGGHLRPLGGITRLPPYPIPPLTPSSPEYIAHLHQVKEKGGRANHTRTKDETEIGYYWLGSSVVYWNRFARAAVGAKVNDDIDQAANVYAKLSWALANAGIVAWEAKNRYDSWRPITALNWKGDPYLSDNSTYYFPSWEPVSPTPTHQEYLSGHAIYGGAASRIVSLFLGTETLDPPITLSNTISLDNAGVLTRTYNHTKAAAIENGISRVYVGAHFAFSSDEGIKAGEQIAETVWKTRNEFL